MSQKLYNLGLLAFKKRWLFLISWIAVVIIAGSLMTAFQKPASDSFTIPGTESQLAFDKLEKSMPSATGGRGQLVFAVPNGKDINDYGAVIDEALNNVSKIEDVASVVSPFESKAISENKSTALGQVALDIPATEVPADLAEKIESALQVARDGGLQAEAGGDIVASAPEGIMGPGEIVGVVVAGITLAITFASLAAAGMPLITALIGVAIGVSGIYALSGVIDVITVTPILAIMLGLAVGIDYALFIITRYRKYLMDGLSQEKAVAKAIATAGNAVVFAAMTVVIALSALTVVGIPFLSTMGLAAAATVAIAASVAVSLIPALLGFAGEKVLSKKQRALLAAHKREETPAAVKKSLSFRYVNAVIKRPFVPIIGIVVVLLALAVPVTQLNMGFPSAGNSPTDTTERKAYDLVTSGFGPGYNGPLLGVAEIKNAADSEKTIETIVNNLSDMKGIEYVQPAGLSKDEKTAVFQIIPTTGPTSPETKKLVATIREDADKIAGNNTELYITGMTAITIDMDNKLSAALPVYLAVVIGLSFILLIMVFRSIIVPLKATLGFLLTIGATFGALVMLFQWGWLGIFDPTPIVSFLPIIVIGIVFGLAMDYEFFLVSGMHEAYQHEDKGKPKAAIVNGFTHGARVVAAAAIIMISVFSGFIFSHMQMVQMIGFALAFGVLIDAFVVRMTLVPAVLAVAGKAAWWIPKWLAKIIPEVVLEESDAGAKKREKAAKKLAKKK